MSKIQLQGGMDADGTAKEAAQAPLGLCWRSERILAECFAVYATAEHVCVGCELSDCTGLKCESR